MTEENNNKDNSQKEITASKKVSEPMDIVIGFQSGANRVQKMEEKLNMAENS